MTVYTQNVNVGSSFEQTYVYTLNDQPVNLTGWGAVFRLRDEQDRIISTVRYGDTGDRSLTIDGSHGTIDVTMVASATSGFTAKIGTFELEIYELINTGRVFRIIDGAVRYRPRGRAMLDNTVCVIRSTTNAVTVETQQVSQYQRIDRGPPGAAGVAALNDTTPAISEDPAVGNSGRALRLDAQYGLAKTNRHGFMRMEDKDAHDRIYAGAIFAGIPDTSGTPTAKSNNASMLNAAFAAAAAKGNCGVRLCALPYNIGTNLLTIAPSQGLRVFSDGSASFNPSGAYTQGARIVYEGGGDAAWDIQISGTLSSSVLIGTGLKTFTNFPAASNIRPGHPVRFTATAGATGSVTGVVYSYNPLGTSITVSVTSVTGSGTGTSWSYTTRYDSAPITARSHAGLVVENVTIECNNAAFRGFMLDANGASLASDTSKLRVSNVMFYASGVSPAAWSDITCVGGVYMTSGFSAVVEHCKFHNMFQSILMRGNANRFDSSNECVHVQDGADFVGEGIFCHVHAEPPFPASGSSFAGGLRVTNSWEPDVGYYAGDASDIGPHIALYGCFSPKLAGNYSIKNTAVGVDKYPVLLDGCTGIVYNATDQHCAGAIRCDGLQACYGIDVQQTQQPLASVFFGSNYAFTRVMCTADSSGYGIQGRQQISNAYLTNGAEATLGMHFLGANGGGPVIGTALNVVGLRTVDYLRGVGAELGLLGANYDVTISASAQNAASGFRVRGYDPDGASTVWRTHLFANAQGVQHYGALTVTEIKDLGDVSGAITIDCRYHQRFKARLVGNITVTLVDPAGPTSVPIVVELTQDGTGSRTLTFNPAGAVKKEATGSLTLTTTAGARDKLYLEYNGSSAWDGWLRKAFA